MNAVKGMEAYRRGLEDCSEPQSLVVKLKEPWWEFGERYLQEARGGNGHKSQWMKLESEVREDRVRVNAMEDQSQASDNGTKEKR